jgi:sulfide:quinone oxidoreductase
MLIHDAFARRNLTDKVRIAVHTVEGAPMATAGPEIGEYIKQELAQRGIGFNPQRKTVGVDAALKRIIFEDGSKARYDLLIAIPPHEAPKIVSDAQLTNASGWIPVDPLTLRVTAARTPTTDTTAPTAADTSAPGTGDIYAVGDNTSVPLPGRFKPDMPLALPKAGVFAEAQGRIVAHQISAGILSQTPSETFDGKGFCFVELGAHRAVRAEGAFFEMPNPKMSKRTPDEAQYQEKQDWVASLLKPATA